METGNGYGTGVDKVFFLNFLRGMETEYTPSYNDFGHTLPKLP